MSPDITLYLAAGCALLAVAAVGFALTSGNGAKAGKTRMEGALGTPLKPGTPVGLLHIHDLLRAGVS